MTFDTSTIISALTAIGVAIAAVGAAYVVVKLGAKAWKMIATAF